MKRMFIIAALAIAISATTFAQNGGSKADQGSNTEEAVLKLTNDWVNAEGNRDAAAMDRIIAEDFVGTAFNGTSVTKKMVMPGPNSGGGMSFATSDLKARAFGETAVVTGRSTLKGEQKAEFYFTLLFVKRQDRWQMVAAHLSPLNRS